MKKVSVLAAVAVLMFATSAAAADGYPEAKAQRPLTLHPSMGEAGLDIGIGLNKDRAAKDLTLGLSFGYGIMNNFEIGANVEALNYGKDLQGAKFGGFSIYGRYAFLDMLAAELKIYAPGMGTYIDEFGDQLVGVEVGLPFQYIIIENLLRINAGLALNAGFASEDIAGKMPQLSVLLKYGVTVNATNWLFFDLMFGTNMLLRPDAGSFGDRTAIPVELTAGGTLLNGKMDIFLTFALADLKPAAGEAFDTKSLGLGARFRF
jgi:hypothetical protein